MTSFGLNHPRDIFRGNFQTEQQQSNEAVTELTDSTGRSRVVLSQPSVVKYKKREQSEDSFTGQATQPIEPQNLERPAYSYSDEYTPAPNQSLISDPSHQNPIINQGDNGFSNGSRRPSHMDGGGSPNKKPDQSITTLQSAWNVTNAIQGMFLVSFPYAVLQGGYWAMFAMIIIAYICCHTGNILVDCLYEPLIKNPEKLAPKPQDYGYEAQVYDQKKDKTNGVIRVRDSYVQIAQAVWGPIFGGHLVNTAQLIELLMTCILYVLLCGELMQGMLPMIEINLTGWIFIATFGVLPNAFLKTLRAVSWLSLWNFIAHLVINGVVIVYCFTRVKEWHWAETEFTIDIWTFPISLGLIVFSYTSQIFLPTLEGTFIYTPIIRNPKAHCIGNMTHPQEFSLMMRWTHIAAAVFKVAFGWIGFLTWGNQTAEVITNNLPSQIFKSIVNFFLLIKALCSYPLPFYASCDLIEKAFFGEKNRFPSCWGEGGILNGWALILRLFLVFFTVVMAACIPHFAILMGLIGSITGTLLSFVWPCFFHLKIKGAEMSVAAKIKDGVILVLGLLCGIVGMYYNAHALSRAFRGLDPDPNVVGIDVQCELGVGQCSTPSSNLNQTL